ncbi:MAG TPA: hypothetical protein VE398_16705 [Acidobacteriota bacterium]|nr:hypothetical protein [Acidobacteriota bacterium]
MSAEFSHHKVVAASILAVILMSALQAAFPADERLDDEKYAGRWDGTYASDGGTGNVTLTFSKDGEGKWHATVRYTNEGGEQTAELKELQLNGTKFTGKLSSPDGGAVITLEGELQGSRLEGTYSVSEQGSTEVAEKGTWKTTRSSAAGKDQ